MKTQHEMLREFISTFEASEDPELWVKLIEEETSEVEEAAAHLQKELADFFYTCVGLGAVVPDWSKLREDLRRRAAEACGRVGVVEDVIKCPPAGMVYEVFRRVHASNMSKLGDDGKPIRREDGKIMKGPNYKAPDLMDIVTGKWHRP